MRRRLVTLVLSLSVAAVLIPAAPAFATTCYVEDPGVDEVKCLLYGTPVVGNLCVKAKVC